MVSFLSNIGFLLLASLVFSLFIVWIQIMMLIMNRLLARYLKFSIFRTKSEDLTRVEQIALFGFLPAVFGMITLVLGLVLLYGTSQDASQAAGNAIDYMFIALFFLVGTLFVGNLIFMAAYILNTYRKIKRVQD